MMLQNLWRITAATVGYLGIIYLISLQALEGGTAVAILFGPHIGVGILCYFILIGPTSVRGLFVLLPFIIYGVGAEVIRPDPNHVFVQLFTALAVGFLALITTLVVGQLVEKRSDSQDAIKENG